MEYILSLLRSLYEAALYSISPYNSNLHVDEQYNLFINNDIEYSRAVFALNNMADVVFPILFNDRIDINQIHHQIYLTKQTVYEPSYVSSIPVADKRWSYVRINMKKPHRLDHVNSAIIDHERRFVFLFEPKSTLKYNISTISDVLGDEYSSYTYYTPSDAGFGKLARVQLFDSLCQTYVLFAFYIITLNPTVEVKDYYKLLTSCITTESTSQFLYMIYVLCQKHALYVDDPPYIWSYNGHFVTKNHKITSNYEPIFGDSDDEYVLVVS